MLIRHDAFAAATRGTAAAGPAPTSVSSASGLSPAVAAHFTTCQTSSSPPPPPSSSSTSAPAFPASPWPTAATAIAVNLKRLEQQKREQGMLEEAGQDVGEEEEGGEEQQQQQQQQRVKEEREEGGAGNATQSARYVVRNLLAI